MSETAYKNHAVRANITQLIDLQNETEFVNSRLGINEDQSWQIDRVFELARVVSGLLESTPGTLTSIACLNNISTYFQQAYSELWAFRNDKSAGHISNANSHVENIIPQLSGFVLIPTSNPDNSFGKILEDVRSRSYEAIRSIHEEKDILATQVLTLKNQLTESEKRVDELITAVAAQKKEAIAVAAEVRAEYSKTETNFHTSFTETVDALKKDFLKFENATKDSTNTILTDLTSKQEEARRIVQVVGNVGVTGNYQNTANKEASTANWMRRFTIAFFIAGVAIAISVLISHLYPGLIGIQVSPEGPWDLALRLLTALAIAAPAIYTAKESARHRTNSDRARQRELELASLGPFIELLPKEKKEEIIHKMTDKYFGTQVEAHEAKPIFDPKDAIDLAKHAIDKMAKITK